MARLLVLLAVALIFAYLVSELIARVKQKISEGIGPSQAAGRSSSPVDTGNRHGELVACATCGIHVSKSRALHASGAPARTNRASWYCSESCRRLSANVS
ncbi:MAG: hypothetical protein GY719_30115 [bacterium]|nr:hypothetical protein [bacterium]